MDVACKVWQRSPQRAAMAVDRLMTLRLASGAQMEVLRAPCWSLWTRDACWVLCLLRDAPSLGSRWASSQAPPKPAG